MVEVTQADRDAAADFYGPHLARPGDWLVEIPPSGVLFQLGKRVGPAVPTTWVAALIRPGHVGTKRTRDPNEALRFARQEDAEGFISAWLRDDYGTHERAFASEHVWMGAALKPDPVAGEAASMVERCARIADAVDADCKKYPGNVARSASAFWARHIAKEIRALATVPTLSGEGGGE